MFWDFSNAKTIIPLNSNSIPVVAGALWVGGYRQGALKMAAQTYRQNGTDFWPGPLDTMFASTYPTNCYSYNTFFAIRRGQIDSQRNHLYGSAPPAAITAWPGNGVSGGGSSYKLAPYADVNHNGTYDPATGDYPIAWGDKTIYQIINDKGNTHTESGGGSFGIEVHRSNYMINCPADSALWNTMFTHYDIINRSVNTYDSVRTSIWLDFSIGNYIDDYIGCDTSLDLFYGYNGDTFDTDTFGFTGYHQCLPAFGAVLLNKKLSSFTTYTTTSYLAPPASNPYVFYNLMKGLSASGTPVYDSADGSAGSHTTRYYFPGDPVAGAGWTEASAFQPPGNRNGIGSTSPVTLNPGDTIKLDVAYVFARDYQNPGNNTAAISKLKQYVQNIKNYYLANNTPCGKAFGIRSFVKEQESISVFPNPASNQLTLNTTTTEKHDLYLYNMNGDLILKKSFNTDITLDLSEIEAGIYQLSLLGHSGIVNKKIIVIR